MPYSEADLEAAISAALPVAHVKAEDQSDGCGGKFEITIVSSAFEGKPLLARHRMIHDVLREQMKDIHALSLKTITPDKWKPAEEAA